MRYTLFETSFRLASDFTVSVLENSLLTKKNLHYAIPACWQDRLIPKAGSAG